MSNEARERFRPFSDPEEFERIIELDTVSEMWTRCVRDYSELPAIVFDGESHTYGQLEEDAARFRAVLKSRTDGKRIVFFAPNSYQFVKAFIASATLGLTSIILPPQLNSQALFGCAMQFGADAVVYDESLSETVDAVSGKLQGKALIKISESGEDSLPV